MTPSLPQCLTFSRAIGPVSHFSRKTDNVPRLAPLRPDQMKHAARADKDGSLFCPALFSGTRGNAGFQTASAVCLDFDKGQPDTNSILAAFDGSLCWLYSTHNHRPENPRYRVVIALSRPVDAGEHTLAVKAVKIQLPADLMACLDASCFERSRAHYLPSCQPDQQEHAVSQIQEGAPLDVEQLLQAGREIPSDEEVRQGTTATSTTGTRPGDDFNRRHDIKEVLELSGWQHRRGDYYAKPDSHDTQEHHAKRHGNGLYIYSTAAPVPAGFYDPWRLLVFSRFNGDFSAAAKEYGSRGYGDQTSTASEPRKIKIDRPPKTKNMESLLDTDFPPIKWAVPGLLPEGLAILSGPPKLGKSWLSLDLCLAVATGGPALGHYETIKGGVLLKALEDNDRRLQARVKMRLTGLPKQNLQNFYYETAWPRLDEGGLEQLEAWIDAHSDCKLVVVDTLQKVKPQGNRNQGNAYEADYAALGGLQRLALSKNVCILVIHHNRKSEDKDAVMTISGSVGITGSVDTIMLLSRTRGGADALLTVTGRDIHEHAVRMSFDGSTGAWTAGVEAHPSEVGLGELATRIMKFVNSTPDRQYYPRDLWDEMGLRGAISVDTLRVNLHRLKEKGLLEKYGDRYGLPEKAV